MQVDKSSDRIEFFLADAARRPLVMGILNVTPDSFSDGGRYQAVEEAVSQALRMQAEGAAIIDIGGESTRPGFTPVSADEEWRRIGPVIGRLAGTLALPLSVDTTKSAVARKALALGAVFVNDIWGLQGDPEMADVAAEAGAAVVVMHNRTQADEGIDIIGDIRAFFDRSLAIAARAGLDRRRLILDPGIGFGKTPGQQLRVIREMGRLMGYGAPLLIGLSRKSFLGRISGNPEHGRLVETLTANLLAVEAGARILRVHDVAEHVAALKVLEAIRGPAMVA